MSMCKSLENYQGLNSTSLPRHEGIEEGGGTLRKPQPVRDSPPRDQTGQILPPPRVLHVRWRGEGQRRLHG